MSEQELEYKIIEKATEILRDILDSYRSMWEPLRLNDKKKFQYSVVLHHLVTGLTIEIRCLDDLDGKNTPTRLFFDTMIKTEQEIRKSIPEVRQVLWNVSPSPPVL